MKKCLWMILGMVIMVPSLIAMVITGKSVNALLVVVGLFVFFYRFSVK